MSSEPNQFDCSVKTKKISIIFIRFEQDTDFYNTIFKIHPEITGHTEDEKKLKLHGKTINRPQYQIDTHIESIWLQFYSSYYYIMSRVNILETSELKMDGNGRI